MFGSLLVFTVIGLSSIVDCARFLDSVDLCATTDPNLKECVLHQARKHLKAFSKGIPELGVEPIDPLHLDFIKMDIPALNMSLSDVTMTGTKSARINEFDIDLKNNVVHVDLNSNLRLKGKYKMSGNLLFLDLSGKGDATIEMHNMHVHVDVKFDLVKHKNGQLYHVFRNHTVFHEVLDKATFDFNGLFNDNQLLSEVTLAVMNNQWRLIVETLAPPAIDTILDKLIDIMAKFFETVSHDEIYSDHIKHS